MQGVAKYASGVAPTAQFPNGSQFQSYIHRNPVPFAQVLTLRIGSALHSMSSGTCIGNHASALQLH